MLDSCTFLWEMDRPRDGLEARHFNRGEQAKLREGKHLRQKSASVSEDAILHLQLSPFISSTIVDDSPQSSPKILNQSSPTN